MSLFLSLDTFAAKRGEGLRPELRALLKRAATRPYRDVTVTKDGMIQSGSGPTPADAPRPQTHLDLFLDETASAGFEPEPFRRQQR